MAITLIAGIKQANNGTFALVDSNDIHGGLYHVDKLAEMQNIPLERIKDGMLCYVSEKKLYYKCSATLDANKKVTAVKWSELVLGSSGNSGGADDIYSHIFVGSAAPDNLDMFWYDTTDDDNFVPDDGSFTLADAKANIEALNSIIQALESRVKYLEENGVVVPGDGPNIGDTSSISKCAITTEDGTQVLYENGRVVVVESYTPNPNAAAESAANQKVEELLRRVDKLLLEED